MAGTSFLPSEVSKARRQSQDSRYPSVRLRIVDRYEMSPLVNFADAGSTHTHDERGHGQNSRAPSKTVSAAVSDTSSSKQSVVTG